METNSFFGRSGVDPGERDDTRNLVRGLVFGISMGPGTEFSAEFGEELVTTTVA